MDLTSVDHLLTTTRSVRKRLDFSRPVEPAIIQRCIEIAIQAPTGSNLQGWQFVVVTEPEKKQALAQLYRKAHLAYRQMQTDHAPRFKTDDLRVAQRPRLGESSIYLAEHMQEAPALIIPCIAHRMEEVPHLGEVSKHASLFQATIYGSILPAVWSLMLALRARGVGSSWTTLHIMYEKEASGILGIPAHMTQAALLAVAYFTGDDFKPARRLPAKDLTHWNTWGQHM